MLNITKANALMKKYGYKSKTKCPYLYNKEKGKIGVCYLFEDENNNTLEKIALFKTEEEMETFLKKYKYFQQNGKENNITMKLENIDSLYSNVIYLKDGIVMEDDDMFNLDKYISIRTQKKNKKDIDKYYSVANNLFNYYYEIKDAQIALSRKLGGLLEQQRSRYFELQLLVDEYNKNKVEHKKLEVSKRNELKDIW